MPAPDLAMLKSQLDKATSEAKSKDIQKYVIIGGSVILGTTLLAVLIKGLMPSRQYA